MALSQPTTSGRKTSSKAPDHPGPDRRRPGKTDAAALVAGASWSAPSPDMVLTKRRRRPATRTRRDLRSREAIRRGRARSDRHGAARGTRGDWPDPSRVEIGEALAPTETFVTGYRIYPFVGRIPHPSRLALVPTPAEVETLLTFSLTALSGDYAIRRLIRRGVPIHTPTYIVGEHLIWGATARILGDFLLLRLPSRQGRPRGSPTPSRSRRSS